MKISFINNFQRDFFGDAASSELVQTGANAVVPGSGEILSIISGIFGNRPNPNDWQGWDEQDANSGYPYTGRSTMGWTISDGDSISNEASNVLSYIKNKVSGDLTFMTKKAGDIGPVTPAQLKSKMQRGGFAQYADQLANQLQTIYNRQNGQNRNNNQSDIQPSYDPTRQNIYTQMPTSATVNDVAAISASATQKSNNKTLIIVAIVIGGLVLIGGAIWAIKSSVSKR